MDGPLIGMTTRSIRALGGIRLDRSQAVAEAYVEAIRWAGGMPVLVPSNVEAVVARELAGRLDGIVLTGGPDVDPALFGEEPQPGLGEIDAVRDEAEIALCGLAVERDVPLLAVCRGLQVLNVAMGGGMVQDLGAGGGYLCHEVSSFADGPGHSVKVERESLLGRIMGPGTHRVNSRHHQGVLAAAAGLIVSARAPDGVVEGLEHPGRRFLVGVEWHPERSYRREAAQGALIRAFVAVCGS